MLERGMRPKEDRRFWDWDWEPLNFSLGKVIKVDRVTLIDTEEGQKLRINLLSV